MELYTYKAIIEKIIDGDTLDCQFSLGMNVYVKQRVRLLGIDTPETKLIRNTSTEEKSRGLEIKQWVTEKMTGREVIIKTYKDAETDKYGRYLGEVFYEQEGCYVSLNNEMIQLGFNKKQGV